MKNHAYAVIGYPLGYSLSPKLHTPFLNKHYPGSTYISHPVSPDKLESFAKNCPFDGFNITIPHKVSIIPSLTLLSPEAHAIGAVNTVRKSAFGLEGTNTDAGGFLLALQHDLKFQPNNKSCLVLGAGGASLAILYALLEKDASTIYLYNRTTSKAKHVINHFKSHKNAHKLELLTDLRAENKFFSSLDLVVNTTSVGMSSSADQSLIPSTSLSKLPSSCSVMDIIYAPSETLLLKEAKSLGLTVTNGLGMLAGQGILAQKYWFKESLTYQEAVEILKNEL